MRSFLRVIEFFNRRARQKILEISNIDMTWPVETLLKMPPSLTMMLCSAVHKSSKRRTPVILSSCISHPFRRIEKRSIVGARRKPSVLSILLEHFLNVFTESYPLLKYW